MPNRVFGDLRNLHEALAWKAQSESCASRWKRPLRALRISCEIFALGFEVIAVVNPDHGLSLSVWFLQS